MKKGEAFVFRLTADFRVQPSDKRESFRRNFAPPLIPLYACKPTSINVECRRTAGRSMAFEKLRRFPAWLGVPLAVACGIAAWLMCDHAKSFAAAGATIAVLGVITIGRPIIRLGYKQWLEASRTMDGGNFPPSAAELTEAAEQNRDALALQVFGPGLVVVGTLMNGFSSYMP